MNLNSFLAALRENPDDITQRLVFADWLEDNNDPDHAELMRLQCGTPPHAPWVPPGKPESPREAELIEADIRQKGKACPGLTVSVHRGMFHLHATEAALKDHKTTLNHWLRTGWVAHLALTLRSGNDLHRLPSTALREVYSLSIDLTDKRDALREFLPKVKHIRRLSLDVADWDDPGTSLATLHHLDMLSWRASQFRRDWLPSLKPTFSRCRSLTLSTPNVVDSEALGDKDLPVLLDSLSSGLVTLDLTNCELTVEGVQLLAGCARLSSLRALNLAGNNLCPAAVTALVLSPHLRRLEHLGLAQTHVNTDGAVELAGSPFSTRLSTLDLSQNDLRSVGAKALASSAHLSNLKRLALRGCSIQREGAKALALSKQLAGLVSIDLDRNYIMGTSDQFTLEQWRRMFVAFSKTPATTRFSRALCHQASSDLHPLRRRAVTALADWWKNGKSLPAEGEPALVAALDDPEADIRNKAAEALVAFPPSIAALPRLLELLPTADPQVRTAILRAITTMGKEAASAEPALLELANAQDKPPHVLLPVALAALGAASDDAVKCFRTWLQSADTYFALVAAGALARLRLDLPTVLAVWRTHHRHPTVDGLNAALAAWPQAVERVLAFAHDAQSSLRAAVTEVLARAAHTEPVIDALTCLLADHEREVKLCAGRAVRGGRFHSPKFIAPLTTWLRDPGIATVAAEMLPLR